MTSPASLTMRQESACNHQIVKTLSLAVWEHQDGVEVPLLVCALTPLQYTSNLGGNSVPLYPFSSENKSHTAVLVPLCTITLAGMNVMPTMKLRLASQQISLPGRQTMGGAVGQGVTTLQTIGTQVHFCWFGGGSSRWEEQVVLTFSVPKKHKLFRFNFLPSRDHRY